MNEKTKTALIILQASVLLGVLGDLLLRESPWGLNIFIWLVLLVSAIIAITFRQRPERLDSHTLALHGALIFFAVTFLLRDSLELKLFNVLAILIILAVQILPTLKIQTKVAGAAHYLISGIWVSLSTAFSPFLLLIEDIKWKAFPETGLSKHLISVAKGLAIALPIVFVFGALFMAADAVFEGLVQNTFSVDLDSFFSHAIPICFISWVVAGYLRTSSFDFKSASNGLNEIAKKPSDVRPQVPSVTLHISDDQTEEKRNKPKEKSSEAKKNWDWRKFDNSVLPEIFTLGSIETGIVLGLINLLFLVFVVIQIPYLFGGIELVQNTPDFKLAEYARRGFGELIAVAALVMPILLVSHWLLKKDDPFAEQLFKILSVIQIGLLFIIMASAAQRLLLLTGNLGYGLTAERLYPLMFIILLVMVFLWFGMTVLLGAREHFAWGALWCGLFVLGTLHVLNPDDFIVKTNVRLMREGRAFDATYNRRLSSDAVPAILESVPLMSDQNREQIFEGLHWKYCEAKENEDIRTWNLSRSRARRLLENTPEVSGRSCSSYSSHMH